MDINDIQDCNVEAVNLFLKDYTTGKNAIDTWNKLSIAIIC
mgnify:CR=1 FL=1